MNNITIEPQIQNIENKTILVITFESGVMKYIPKNQEAIDFIVCYLDCIEEIHEVDLDEWFQVENKANDKSESND